MASNGISQLELSKTATASIDTNVPEDLQKGTYSIMPNVSPYAKKRTG